MFIFVYICIDLVKNNHNYTVQIIHFLKKILKLCVMLAYTFFNHIFLKYVMIFHIYIYIYIVLMHGASDRSFDIVYFVFFIWIIIKIIKFSSILKHLKGKIIH